MAPDAMQELENVLIGQGIIDEDTLVEAREVAKNKGRDITAVLIDTGKVTEEAIAFAISNELGVPFFNVVPEMTDIETIKEYSVETLWRCLTLPLFQEGHEVLLVMGNPLDADARVEVADLFDEYTINFAVGTPSAIVNILKQCIKDSNILSTGENRNKQNLKVEMDDPGAVLFVFRHLVNSIQKNAKEIHFSPTEEELIIYYRIKGKLEKQETVPLSFSLAVSSRLKILAGVSASDNIVQNESIKTTLQGKEIKLNLTIIQGVCGEIMTLTFETTKSDPKVSGTFINEELDELIQQMSMIPNGLILLVNPEPMKVRHLAHSLLKEFTRHGNKSFSIEAGLIKKDDDVLQINRNDSNFSMEDILYENPDMLYIEGQVSEHLWSQILAKRLVLLPVYCCSPVDAICSIIRELPVILASRLLRTILVFAHIKMLCPHCSEPTEIPQALLKIEPLLISSNAMKPAGCKECDNTGYGDDTVLYDCIWADKTLRELVANSPSRHDIAKFIRAYIGNSSYGLLHKIIRYVKIGDVSFDQIWTFL